MTNAENLGGAGAAAVKKKASGSSFYLAMRLMPPEERDAMFAIYVFCRKVDDIADDGVGTRSQRHDRLEQWRSDLAALYAGGNPATTRFLAPAVTQFGLRQADFLTILDGMDMDVAEDIVAPGLATLDLYCDRVASAVGRLSIKIFGMEESPGFDLAHHLGRALQLTNILARYRRRRRHWPPVSSARISGRDELLPPDGSQDHHQPARDRRGLPQSRHAGAPSL